VRGAPDILAVALEAGYGSHEAFTRAFHEQFGFTPEAIRDQGHLGGINVMEPIKMEENLRTSAPPVRLENGKVLLVAGIASHYTCETSAGIPSQWQRFLPHIGTVPGQIGRTAFGVRYNSDDKGNLITYAVSKYLIFREFRQISRRYELPRRNMRYFRTATTSRPSGAPGRRSGTSGSLNRDTKLSMHTISSRMARSLTPGRETADLNCGYRSKHKLSEEHDYEYTNRITEPLLR